MRHKVVRLIMKKHAVCAEKKSEIKDRIQHPTEIFSDFNHDML